MSMNQESGEFIQKQVAQKMHNDYKTNPNPLPNELIYSHFFGVIKLNAMLDAVQGVMGIRVYYGKAPNDAGVMKQQLMIVAVDSEGKDVTDTNMILDFSTPCPTFCGNGGGL